MRKKKKVGKKFPKQWFLFSQGQPGFMSTDKTITFNKTDAKMPKKKLETFFCSSLPRMGLRKRVCRIFMTADCREQNVLSLIKSQFKFDFVAKKYINQMSVLWLKWRQKIDENFEN